MFCWSVCTHGEGHPLTLKSDEAKRPPNGSDLSMGLMSTDSTLATEEKSWPLPKVSGAGRMETVGTAGEVIKAQTCCLGAHYILGERSVQADSLS